MNTRLHWVAMVSAMVAVVPLASRAEAGDQAIREAIQQGLDAHANGRADAAISSLQQAISLIQKSQQSGVADFLPKTMPGCTAHDVEREQFSMGTGNESTSSFRLTRRFTRDADGVGSSVSLVNIPEIVTGHREMIQALRANPMMLQMMNRDPNVTTRIIDQHGWTGWQKVDREAGSGEVMLFSGKWLLEVRSDVAEPQLLEALLAATKLKEIAAIK